MTGDGGQELPERRSVSQVSVTIQRFAQFNVLKLR